jgi:hypothetical protein
MGWDRILAEIKRCNHNHSLGVEIVLVGPQGEV